MDRRALFFLGASVLAFLLSFVADDKYRTLTYIVAGVYLVLAALSALDHWSRTHAPPRSAPPRTPPAPPAEPDV